ncbi:MAG: hypothetical protein K2J63_08125 [Muribaculaceae bacterium]|nr:hypothetical protein [Muribaculaceae bacterium]MDE6795258.1 hypothetical protein [Muribaculaceae bacterium]
MEKIPQKYLSASNHKEACANIRQFLASGLSVKSMAEQLTEKYRKSKYAVREHLGKMLASVYDFENSEIARECARMFGIEPLTTLSVSESIRIYGLTEDEKVFSKREFSNAVTENLAPVDTFPAAKWPMVVEPHCYDDIITISNTHNIYAAMGENVELNLFIFEPSACDILIDETVFGDEEPLYFTEINNFVSPVFKINVLKRLLDFCLEEVGYPYIKINKKVIFTSAEAYLINIDQYVGEDYRDKAWEGVEAVMMKDVIPHYAVSNTGSLFYGDDPDSPYNQLRSIVLYSLIAASMLYETVWAEKLSARLSPKSLAELCQKLNIFI